MKCPTCGHVARTSRATDLDTARAAGRHYDTDARRFSTTSRQARLLRAIKRKPLTALGAAVAVLGKDAPPTSLEAARRRVSDLRHAGFVTDSGLRARNFNSPDEAIRWKITEEGEVALRLLKSTGWSW